MAKKKTKKVVEEIKSFNMPTGVINEDIQWQQPEGFSLQNKMQTIMVDQWPLHVLGLKSSLKISKDTMVVLLGPLESLKVYKHLALQMRETHNLVFVSLPCFGMNMDVDVSDQDIELKSFADFVESLLKAPALEGHTLHLLGSSAAASVALETSLRWGDKISSLIVNGITHKPTKIWQLLLSEVVHRLDNGDYLDCADAALLYLVSDDILGRGRTWGVFRQYFRKKLEALNEVQKQCLNKLVQLVIKGDGLSENTIKNTPSCRVLAFTGEYDHLSAPYDHAHFTDACVNGTFATLDDADHLIHVERPRVVAQLVKGFMAQINLDTIDGVRTYPPHSYVTLDRRRDPRYVTNRPKIKIMSDNFLPPEEWEDAVPSTLFAKLRNINFSGCLLEMHDERFRLQDHAGDLKIYLPKVDMTLEVLAFEQANRTLRCLFFHKNYQAAMEFKEMLEYGEHFVDADLEMDDYLDKPEREMPWLGAKRHGGGVY